LVIQGLTLAPLVRALRVGSAGDTAREIAALRQRAAGAALDEVHASASGQDVPEPVRRAAVLQYEGYLAAQDALNQARGHHTDDSVDPDYPRALDDLLRRANEVERGIVLEARRRGEVSAEAADEVLADVEGRAVRELS
jgi:hypothetical protein